MFSPDLYRGQTCIFGRLDKLGIPIHHLKLNTLSASRPTPGGWGLGAAEGQSIPGRERSVSFLPTSWGRPNISWSSLVAKEDAGVAKGFPKGMFEKDGIG